MDVVYFPDDPRPPRWMSPVLALGNFDGLHRGHQKIVERIRRSAADKFQGRFTRMETRAVTGGTRLADLTLDQQNALWDTIKRDDAEAARRAVRTEAP